MAGGGARALAFLINIGFSLYIAAVLLRLILQKTGADWYNPIVQFLVRITQPILGPLHRIIPSYRGWDIAAFLFAVALTAVEQWLLFTLARFPLVPRLYIRIVVLKFIGILINLYVFTIIVQALMSWFRPQQYNPVAAVLWRMNEPILRPIRRIIPPLGGTIDLSPLIAIVILEAIAIALNVPVFL